MVDTQHQTLFQYVNNLEALASKPTIDKVEVDHLVEFLESYVVNHFRFEETCMQRFHCPAHEQNKKSHAQFLEVWKKFRAAYEKQGPNPRLLQKVHEVAKGWILNHICKVDVSLRDSVAAQAH